MENCLVSDAICDAPGEDDCSPEMKERPAMTKARGASRRQAGGTRLTSRAPVANHDDTARPAALRSSGGGFWRSILSSHSCHPCSSQRRCKRSTRHLAALHVPPHRAPPRTIGDAAAPAAHQQPVAPPTISNAVRLLTGSPHVLMPPRTSGQHAQRATNALPASYQRATNALPTRY